MLSSLQLFHALTILLIFPGHGYGYCHDPDPAFPLPELQTELPELQRAFGDITETIQLIISDEKFKTSSFSIEVTSSKETLWSLHHTAEERDDIRPGTTVVNGSSVYRIASVSKVFTVLGLLQQHASGNLTLDDTIDKYVPELGGQSDGGIPWRDITLRSLASQLSGIPGDVLQPDSADPTRWGLPPPVEDLPKCGGFTNKHSPCSRKDVIDALKSKAPVYAPNQKSTYANLGFVLLGLAVENVTQMSYADYVNCSIFQPLNMSSSSLVPPPDSVAVLPKGPSYWGVDEGIQNPTGGIYSSSADLTKMLRYILTHYNGVTSTLNWIQPASFSSGLTSLYGMPWEIFRSVRILKRSSRPVTFVTKSGSVPGYFSIVIVVPEYDFGITILVAGSEQLMPKLREAVSAPLVEAAYAVAHNNLIKYTGTFTSSSINSSVAIALSWDKSLHITSWISNGTDMLATIAPLIDPVYTQRRWHAQLVPTLLFRDQEKQKGELWRVLFIPGRNPNNIWDDFCIEHVELAWYDGQPLNQVVFWMDDEGQVGKIELSAFRITLRRGAERRGEAKTSDSGYLSKQSS